MSITKWLDEQEKMVSGLKLRSDDHGHSCDDLRIYCENKLIEYAGIHLPALIKALRVAIDGLRCQGHYDSESEWSCLSCYTKLEIQKILGGE